MTDADRLARTRYFTIVAVNMVATAGAVFGLVLAGRSDNTVQTAIGAGILLSALYFMAVVPRAMARRWKTPEA
ncbi:hypothetical protein [Sphingomonas soli]|uniref:hypothetical protein n=1 Tax=Sphingomonas soli TaxID=266127 RepID=UPI000832BAF2|nr:hypothetical protein [Sphingomonas soli]